jgi:shikimate kinase
MIEPKVVLIGPMGAGKSTLGRLVASSMGWQYFDNDDELTTRYAVSEQVLSSMAVAELHKLESRYLADILKEPAPFITGAAASVIDYPDSAALLNQATAIYLRIPLTAVLARAGVSGVGRQALSESGNQILSERYERRDPKYRQVAKLTLELSDNPVADAALLVEFLGGSGQPA